MELLKVVGDIVFHFKENPGVLTKIAPTHTNVNGVILCGMAELTAERKEVGENHIRRIGKIVDVVSARVRLDPRRLLT